MKRKLRLTYPSGMTGEPVIARLVRECNLDINILQAYVSPGMQGELLLELEGTTDDIARGIVLLEGTGIVITEQSRKVMWDSEKCMHCGCCTSVCPSSALCLDDNAMLTFIENKCFLCESCISTCPVNTLKLTYAT